MKSLFIVIAFFYTLAAFAQEDAVLLVIPNQDAVIILDGVEQGSTKAGAAYRMVVKVGEHYVEARNSQSQTSGELIQTEAGKQKILRIEFSVNSEPVHIDKILIADINFNVPGITTVMAWQSNNPGLAYPNPEFYYAFEKGDEIFLDVSMSNAKGTNSIRIASYPNDVVRYTNNAFTSLTNVSIKIPERSIYKFTVATNHAFDRNCFIKVRRMPGSPETVHFNSTVSRQTILTPIVVTEPQSYFINSGSNATFMGGKSRVLLPIQLPQNTIEWVYRFSASRSKDDIDNVKNNFKLFSELSTLALSLTGPMAKAGTLAVDKLTQPPGANYCDIYLLPRESAQLFEAKQDAAWKHYQDASRVNFMSGNVKVTCCNTGSFVIGIKNPDPSYGIHAVLEVVAITAKEEYVMENNQ
ncbi:MAG: hypothetical protein JNM78_10895 [Cyclobacteriaceae bacterium]|jgi:hypothetical protein|nr:hypothetical protein [Cyclobacteriaceae bacterium]